MVKSRQLRAVCKQLSKHACVPLVAASAIACGGSVGDGAEGPGDSSAAARAGRSGVLGAAYAGASPRASTVTSNQAMGGGPTGATSNPTAGGAEGGTNQQWIIAGAGGLGTASTTRVGISATGGGATEGGTSPTTAGRVGATGGTKTGPAGTAGTYNTGGSSSGSSGRASANGGSSNGTCGSGSDAICNDNNPCTLDTVDDDCSCKHATAADGTTCDDGYVCTKNDTCSGGVCVGTAPEKTQPVLGELHGFGQNPGLMTLVAFPSENRAVFAQSHRLTLVGLDNDQVKMLDDVSFDAGVSSGSVGSGVWANRPHTFLIPVQDHQLAIANPDWGIDLYDLTGDKLKSVLTYGFGTGTWPIVAAAGDGQRLFACTSYQLQRWSFNQTATPITRGGDLAFPAGHRCLGLALSPDGTTLYAATSGGLERIDVSAADGTMVFGTEARAGNLVVDVQATEKYVAIFEIREATSGYGDVTVLSADTLSPLTTFAAELTSGGTVPVGFSLLDNDRILLQFAQSDTNGCYAGSAATFALGAVPAELNRRSVLKVCDSPYRTPSFHTVANGRHAAIEPMHQIVAIDPSSASITPIASPQQGSFEFVRASDPDTVVAYGLASIQRVDIKTPTAPRVVAGGLESPLALDWLRLDLTDLAAPSFVTVSEAAWGVIAGPQMTLLRADSSGLPVPIGTMVNDDTSGTWATSGKFIYQVTATGTKDFRIRGFAPAAVLAANGQKINPDLEQTLATEVSEFFNGRGASLFSMDAKNGDLVIVETRQNTSSSSSAPHVSRFIQKDGSFVRQFTKVLDPGLVTDIVTGNGLSVLFVDHRPVFVDRDGNYKNITLNDTSSLIFEDLLLLDEKKLVIAVSWKIPKATEGVLILRPSDFTEVARYPTSEPIMSYADVGEHVAFGAKTTLSIANAACFEK